jgi:hypothetical protein
MGAFEIPANGSGGKTNGEEAGDTVGFEWYLLVVHLRCERKAAAALTAKGYEVFLPMHTVRRQWSDRMKVYEEPLFPGHIFCRISLRLTKLERRAFKTPHVADGLSIPIPDGEIDRMRRVMASQYPVECCAPPQTGEIVEAGGVRGVLVERGSPCRVAVGFDSIGRTVILHVPLEDLKFAGGDLEPHWSLRAL